MTELLPRIEFDVPGTPRGSVIWLHGLGASGHDFEPVIPLFELPDVRFILPHAPERAVTINRGLVMPAWYDILTLERAPVRERLADVQASARAIEDLIAEERRRGVPAARIVIAGFSQGGAMALYSGLRHGAPLAGIVALSAYLVAAASLKSEINPSNTQTPILFCHGQRDPLVNLQAGMRARDEIAALNPTREIEFRTFPMEHEVSTEEIDVIKTWLHERFDS